jgi:hypothetical protein
MNQPCTSRRLLLPVLGALLVTSPMFAQTGPLFNDAGTPTAGAASPAPAVVPVAPAAPAAPAVKPAAVPATQPSVDAVQAAMDAKDFQTAVKLASKVLALKGPAAAGISRFQVMMMKADAQAAMKQIPTAVMTYKSAMKETKDVKEIALARWTAELFHTAGSVTYTPKLIAVGVPKRGPFDLNVPEQRKEAFGALLDDDLSALDPKIKSATVSQSLPQIWPVLQQVIDLDALDQIANASDDKTSTLASSLLDHCRNLLSNKLKEDWARLGDIDTHANQTLTVNNQAVINNTLVNQTTTKKNGLSENNKTELSNMIVMAQKIRDTAGVFINVAKTDQGWTTIQSDADRVAGKASDVLNADYGDAVTSSNSTDTTPGYGIPAGNQFGTGINNGGINTGVAQPAVPPKVSNGSTRSNPGTNPKTGKGTGTNTGTGN